MLGHLLRQANKTFVCKNTALCNVTNSRFIAGWLCHGNIFSKTVPICNFAHIYFHKPKQTAVCVNKTVQYASMTTDTSQQHRKTKDSPLVIQGKTFDTDDWTNVTEKILGFIGRDLHMNKDHPLCLIKDVIVQHFYCNYMKSTRTPLFAVFDNFFPVVTVQQNFDSMLIPENDITRKKSDNYYINKDTLLRAHTSAHEFELLKSGLDAFIVVGDVYRRDAIDSSHFPVFHQMEGVRLFNKQQLFCNSEETFDELSLFEDGHLTEDKQACHTMEAAKMVELKLKKTLEDLVRELFGRDVAFRWVDAYFPFTHPSFEMEIFFDGEWMEMLGCGVLRQEILNSAGAKDSIGWAFGLGLERLAMRLFNIPDIRYFWSNESSFLLQFKNCKNIKEINFKPLLSNQPVVRNDISFWVPKGFCSNDFYDLVRNVDSNIVETVSLVDSFVHPKTNQESHCYRIFYRHTQRPLNQKEVSALHEIIKKAAVEKLNVTGRW